MGRELQKRKARSSRSKVKTHNRRKKALNPLGSSIIAKNWNKKETLSQNYTRFGLVAKLGKQTGGTAPKNKSNLSASNATDPLAAKSADNGLLKIREVKVERDAQGKILRIVRDTNPLNDPLNDLESDNGEEEDSDKKYEEWGGFTTNEDRRKQIQDADKPEVLRKLEMEATRPMEKPVRHQSDREREWLERLVDKYGDNVVAMARDKKLNPMQQTTGDLARRLRKAGLLPS
ncbi:ribosome biogenesis protein Nop16 [Podospora fimiseda]|uniref:Nucleolar protein 16 n=1 Tax=Podospora fimiseda TaxID=252190 RepID=A0AAN7BN44_9PEZI|nr:ribosome biogenesis protein Nop16 [Podospora fimiseda]